MASIDEIVARLRQAVDQLREAVGQARGAREVAREIQERCEGLGVRDVAEGMKRVADRATELAAVLAAGIDALQRLIAQTEAIRHGGRAGSVDTKTVPAGGGAAEPDEPTTAPQPPRLTNATFGDAVDRLPARAGTRGPTWGQVFDEAGDATGEPIRSSRDDHLTDDLDLDREPRLSEAMTSHVEAKVAAAMRRGDLPQHVTVVINNMRGPCGWAELREGKRRFGTSCDELLADVLPASSTLTVRWRNADGWARRAVYRGTGRRIRR